jgi:PAS domain-containing protein
MTSDTLVAEAATTTDDTLLAESATTTGRPAPSPARARRTGLFGAGAAPTAPAARRLGLFGPGAEPAASPTEGVITTNASLVVSEVDQAAADLLGWPDAGALAAHLNQTAWSVLGADVRAELGTALGVRGRWEGSAHLPRPDGSKVYVVLTACTHHGAAGLPTGVVLTVRPAFSARSVASHPPFGTFGSPRGMTAPGM